MKLIFNTFGDADYIEQMQAKITVEPDLGEVLARQRRPVSKSIEYYARKYKDRDQAMRAACQSGGYCTKDPGIYFDLHYSSVSRIVNGKYHAQ